MTKETNNPINPETPEAVLHQAHPETPVTPEASQPAAPQEPSTSQESQPGAPHPNAPYPDAPYPNVPYPNAPYPNAPYPNAPYPNTPYPNTPYPNTFPPNAPYYYGRPYQPLPKQPYPCTLTDGLFALLAIVVGFLYIDCVFGALDALGAGVTAFTGILLAFTLAYFKKSGVALPLRSWPLFGATALSAAYFFLFSNPYLAFLNLIFLTACFVYWVCSSLDTRAQKRLGSFFIRDLARHIFVVPFSNFAATVKSIQKITSQSGKTKTVLLLICGILVALPLTLIIVLLLSNADPAFFRLVKNIADNIGANISRYIFDLMLGIPVAFYLFGLLFGCVKKRSHKTISDEAARENSRKLKFLPGSMAVGALASFILIYVLFYAAQFQYLFSAFNLILPEGFGYADYARRGFFELCMIVCINLGILLCMRFFVKSKDTTSETPKFLKPFNIFLSLFTIGFIGIALSKMAMYIHIHGLTPLRVYTSWFMLFLFIVFVSVIIWQFRTKMNIVRITVCAGAAMFLILCFANTDAIIAKYNTEAYLSGQLEISPWDYASLSDSAAPYVEQIYLESDNNIVKNDAKSVLHHMKIRANAQESWRHFNLSSFRAQEIYARY